jgi:hypothetical protein
LITKINVTSRESIPFQESNQEILDALLYVLHTYRLDTNDTRRTERLRNSNHPNRGFVPGLHDFDIRPILSHVPVSVRAHRCSETAIRETGLRETGMPTTKRPLAIRREALLRRSRAMMGKKFLHQPVLVVEDNFKLVHVARKDVTDLLEVLPHPRIRIRQGRVALNKTLNRGIDPLF